MSTKSSDSTSEASASLGAGPGIHERFEVQARQQPQSVAVTTPDDQIRYGALNTWANRIAQYLRTQGVNEGTRVGLCISRSIEAVAGILGILKAGGAYVPLDPNYPGERLKFMARTAETPVILTRGDEASTFASLNAQIVSIDDAPSIQQQPARRPETNLTENSLAYTIFTSGSTGTPKGVQVTHRNVTRLFDATDSWFGFDDTDVWTLFHSLSFDFSVWELWGALTYGGRLVVVPHTTSRDPEQVFDLLVQEQVTVFNQTPSAFRQLLGVDTTPAEDTQLALRTVIFGGEALQFEMLKDWYERFDDQHPQLVNMYGITETTVHVTYYPISADDVTRDASVVGVPLKDLDVYVLDEDGDPVEDGERGELYVSGPGVSAGYINRDDLNETRFLDDPFRDDGTRMYRTGDLGRILPDGNIEHLGRIDSQVNLRGFRIELGEVEAALREHPDVSDVAVDVKAEDTDDPRLVAYPVPEGDADLSGRSQDLRAFAEETLPCYMVPNFFLPIAQLPLTTNNKLDRDALPWPPDETDPTGSPSEGPEEAATEGAGTPEALSPSSNRSVSQIGEPSPPSHESSSDDTSSQKTSPVSGDETITSPESQTPHRSESSASRLDALTSTLCTLAEDVLNIGAVDADADLIDRGATSMTLVNLSRRIDNEMDVSVPVDVLLDTATIRDIAGYLAETRPALLDEFASDAPAGTGAAAPASATGSASLSSASSPRPEVDDSGGAASEPPSSPPKSPRHDPASRSDSSSGDETGIRGTSPHPGSDAPEGESRRTATEESVSSDAGAPPPSSPQSHPDTSSVEEASSDSDRPDADRNEQNQADRDDLQVVLEIVRDHLNVDTLHPDDNLYAKGATSIALTQIKKSVEDRFGGDLSIDSPPSKPTVRDLNALLQQTQPEDVSTDPSAGDGPSASSHRPARSSQQATAGSAVQHTEGPNGDSGRADEQTESVAIVGMSARFPGAETLDAFWQNLREGHRSIGPVPESRTEIQAMTDSAGNEESLHAGFLGDVQRFDSLHFNISPREAREMSPEERIMLESAWSCLEDAGYTPGRLTESADRVGVFVGIMWGDYDHVSADVWRQRGEIAGTAVHSSVATRVSHVFDFRGPSLAVDTTCSSALSALHLARTSVERGECDAALVGGINLITHPYHARVLDHLDVLDRTGASTAFGAEVDGWTIGEGVGCMLLRPHADARAERDNVRALIRGSWTSHWGQTQGRTRPNAQSQADSMREALHSAGVSPADVSYVETGASGAAMADAAEMAALSDVFENVDEVAAGSVKSNVGHLEAASGLSQLAKVVLQLQHGEVAPTVAPSPRNPLTEVEDSPVRLVTDREPWPSPPASGSAPRPSRRCALINSFAAEGTCSHAVLEAPPPRPAPETGDDSPAARVVPLSAASSDQLHRLARALRDTIHRRSSLQLGDVAFTMQEGRREQEERLAVVAEDIDELAERLTLFLEREISEASDADGIWRATASSSPAKAGAGARPAALAASWCQGDAVDWSRRRAPEDRRVSLPTYPFGGQRFWPETAEISPVASSNGHRSESGRNPHRSDQDQRTENPSSNASNTKAANPSAQSALQRSALTFVRSTFEEVAELPEGTVDVDAPMTEYGLNSAIVNGFNDRLVELGLDHFPRTLFFEHRTLRELASSLVDQDPDQLATALDVSLSSDQGGTGTDASRGQHSEDRDAGDSDENTSSGSPSSESAIEGDAPGPASRRSTRPASSRRDVAIVGLNGRYPGAESMDAFWDLLVDGEDQFRPIPSERWDWEAFYDEEQRTPGAYYNPRGAFLEDVDGFDPLFFDIAPTEAASIDPQDRLFLQTAWQTMEDAGYTPSDLSSKRVGVFAGVSNDNYERVTAEAAQRRPELMAQNTQFWSVANRVSYTLDLHGPSLTVDTACSSSLTAVQMAVDSIRSGRSDAAFAGGVNLILHPSHYVRLGMTLMLARGEVCHPFGADADGMLPGEGVGCVLLKPLDQARADDDRIYGVIRGCASNHGGTTNGYTVPNPQAQARLVKDALDDAGVAPRTIDVIETHGTGTSLGDPIEVRGLNLAFQNAAQADLDEAPSCALSSVKSNIGHLEAAAGIAGLTKLLLQLKHERLAPSLHADPLNPDINFDQTPFRVQTDVADWTARARTGDSSVPRRAGISSFGAGGANVHLIVEAFEQNRTHPQDSSSPLEPVESVIVPLSARTSDRLRTIADQLADHLNRHTDLRLRDVAYTLQVGRQAMQERAAFVVSSREELTSQLRAFATGDPSATARGSTSDASAPLLADTDDVRVLVDRWLDQSTNSSALDKIAEVWVRGAAIDWGRLPQATNSHRVSLPGYPFERRSCWIGDDDLPLSNVDSVGKPSAPATESPTTQSGRPAQGSGSPGASSGPSSPTAVTRAEEGTSTNGPGGDGPSRGSARPASSPGSTSPGSTSPGSTSSGSTSSGSSASTASPPSTDGLVDQVADAVREAVALEIDVDLATIRPDATYRDLGVDSVVAVDVVERVNQSLDVDLRSTDLFNYPTIQDLSTHIVKHFDVRSDNLSEPASSSPPAGPGSGDASVDFCYAPEWVREEVSDSQAPAPDQVLVVRTSGTKSVFNGLAARHRRSHVIDLVRDSQTAPVGNGRWTWNAEDARSAFRSILSEIPQPDRVYFLPSLDPDAYSADTVDAEEMNRALDGLAFLTACHEVGWMESGFDLVLTTHRTAYLDGDETVNPAGSSLRGLVRGAERESVSLRTSTVDLAPQKRNGQWTLQDASVDALAREPMRVNDFVAIRGGSRWVRTLQPVDLSPASGAQLRQGGVYLILGGAGGLGLELAVDWAQRASARIAVIGRSDLTEKRRKRLQRIEDAGGEVLYLQADGTDRPAMQRAVDRVHDEFGALDGAVHAAVTTGAGPLPSIDDVLFRQGAAIKIVGSIVLAEVALPDDPDFLQFYSSVQSLANTPEEAPYASGSVFEDTWASYLDRTSDASIRLVNWGPWGEVGVVSDEESKRAMREAGLRPIQTVDGLQTAHRILSNDVFQVVPVDAERRFLEWIGVPSSMISEDDATGGTPSRRTTASSDSSPTPDESPPNALASSSNGSKSEGPHVSTHSERDPSPASQPTHQRERQAAAQPGGRELSSTSEDPSSRSKDGPPVHRVNRFIREVVAEEVDVDPGELDADSTYEKYGVDSIIAVDIVNRLNDTLDVDLRSPDLFNYPTIEALSNHLCTEFDLSLPQQTRGTSSASPGDDARPDDSPPDQESGSPPRNSGDSSDDPSDGSSGDSSGGVPIGSPSPDVPSSGPSSSASPMNSGEGDDRSAGPGSADAPSPGSPSPASASGADTASSESSNDGGNLTRDPIAVIGMSGRFPKADDLHAYWTNLAEGRDCIDEVPESRWGRADYYSERRTERGKSYSKWGGMLDRVDTFDAPFFNISAQEALQTDPQQRLFLEESWKAFEDAGYASTDLSGANCGVYVGCTASDYGRHLDAAGVAPTAHRMLGSTISILAARIAYYLNLKGPSLAVDTACSSSLVAIHLACQALWNGTCDLALAGGVQLLLTPQCHVRSSQAGMLSPTGRCHTFDADADGMVPGEGVGALVLKPLSEAREDGDHVEGVIRGVGVNQDGQTNGITAPNGPSQTALEREIYDRFDLDARSIGYVEAHGTGTPLGDPIEVDALARAFREDTDDNQFCAIGSVKTNIGHTLSAAGVAGVLKVLLSMRHGQLPPSLHFQRENEHLDFSDTPFYVNTDLQDWSAANGEPRRAAVSSFGFSGTNAHLVMEEAPVQPSTPPQQPAYLLALSAKTSEALDRRIDDFIAWADRQDSTQSLHDVAYTLLCGRDHFAHRCAVVAGDLDEARRLFTRLRTDGSGQGRWRGTHTDDDAPAPETSRILDALRQDDVMETAYRTRLTDLAQSYVAGADVAWQRLFEPTRCRRVSMPTYPFDRHSYWEEADYAAGEFGEQYGSPAGDFPDASAPRPDDPQSNGASRRPESSPPADTDEPISNDPETGDSPGTASLHPLLDADVSAPGEIRFSKTFRPDDPVVRDHEIAGTVLLPGAAHAEMARGAAARGTGHSITEIRQLVWQQPLVVDDPVEVLVIVEKSDDDWSFRIAPEEHPEKPFSTGILRSRSAESSPLDDVASLEIDAIRDRCPGRMETDEVYSKFAEAGFEYGPLYRVIDSLHASDEEVLARLETPNAFRETADHYGIFPPLLDGAFQALAGMPQAGDAVDVPFYLDRLRFSGSVGPVCWVHVETESSNPQADDVTQYTLTLADSQGRPKIRIDQFSARGMDRSSNGASDASASPTQDFSASAGAPSDADASTDPTGSKVADDVAGPLLDYCVDLLRYPEKSIDLDTPIEEYGIDSVGMMEVFGFIEEQFNVIINPTLIAEIESLGDLVDYVEEKRDHNPQAVKSSPSSDEADASAETDTSAASSNGSGPEASRTSGSVAAGFEGSGATNNGASGKPPELAVSPNNSSSEDTARPEPIAVVAMSGRLPESHTLEAFWRHLLREDELIREIPESRWDYTEVFDPEPGVPDKTYSKWAGLVPDVDAFDASFFDIDDVDALVMDPQQRILLELAQELFDRSGYSADEMAGRNVDVILGAAQSKYDPGNHPDTPDAGKKKSVVNTIQNMMAARISDFYDLRGTALTVDTACSSSLLALHEAAQNLRRGRCEMAIAGGATVLVDEETHVGFSQAEVLSDDGSLYVFDERAKGFTPGEGAAIVLLKRLSDAWADGDQILATIRGSATNNDGSTMGITTPNMKMQRRCIRTALDNAGVSATDVSYLEAHGTGTLLGDPIEIKAASQAFHEDTDRVQYCKVGSVKSNIGHLMHTSGVAGFVKVVMSLYNRVLPATLNCTNPHPRFSFESSPFQPVTETRPWDFVDAPRLAGISSFGFGGTNVHMILEEFPAEERGYNPTRSPSSFTQFDRKRYWLGRPIESVDTSWPSEEVLYQAPGIRLGGPDDDRRPSSGPSSGADGGTDASSDDEPLDSVVDDLAAGTMSVEEALEQTGE